MNHFTAFNEPLSISARYWLGFILAIVSNLYYPGCVSLDRKQVIANKIMGD